MALRHIKGTTRDVLTYFAVRAILVDRLEIRDMETYATTKGQIVIPSLLRRKYGIKKGTKLLVYDDGEYIKLKPITQQYLTRLQGCLKGKGLLRILLEERAKDKARE